MGMRPKFSVIVPMYNVEDYLSECVESIRHQTLRDIEIILVDDGSPDRCGQLAEEYAAEDPRVQVVHRVNGGLGPARNSGMKVAHGEYIGFVDSDDWVEPDMFERLYEAASMADADVVFTGLKIVSRGNIVRIQEHPFARKTLLGEDQIFTLRAAFFGALPSKILEDPTPVSVWVAGYRRSFINALNLRFLNVRSEDIIFNTYACRAAKVVACIPGSPYCYRKDDQPSITKSFDFKTIDSFCRFFRVLEQLSGEEPRKFWGECHVRQQRCIVDYCRALIRMIESSGVNSKAKHAYAKEVVRHPALRRACKGYPWWRLPILQAIFFLALKMHAVKLAQALVCAKRRTTE